MSACNSETIMSHIFKGGYKLTNNLFFVEDVLFWELLDTTFHIENYANGIVHKSVQSSRYLAWNYKTGDKRYVDAKCFRTQLLLFKCFKETHPGYMDSLYEDILDYDLFNIAIRSEHLF